MGPLQGLTSLVRLLRRVLVIKTCVLFTFISTFMKFLSVARLKCSYGQLVFSSPSYSTASIFVTGAPVNLCWTCYDHKVSGFISQDGSAKTVLAILIPGMQLQPLVTNGTNNFAYRSVFFFLYLIHVANLMNAWVLGLNLLNQTNIFLSQVYQSSIAKITFLIMHSFVFEVRLY